MLVRAALLLVLSGSAMATSYRRKVQGAVGTSLLLLVCSFLSCTPTTSFDTAPTFSIISGRGSLETTTGIFLSSSSSEFPFTLIQAAKTKLLWETLQERQDRPVLDLSARDVSPEQEEQNESDDRWKDGHFWSETKRGLLEIVDQQHGEDAFSLMLESTPQLMRLEPSMVLETARVLQQTYGINVMDEPRLLTFKLCHVEYGIEFLSTMMALDLDSTKRACSASPQLLLGGIEGGLQELAVKQALNAAADATSKANQKVAGDAMKSLKNLKEKKDTM